MDDRRDLMPRGNNFTGGDVMTISKDKAIDWLEKNLGPCELYRDSSTEEFVVSDIIDNDFRGATIQEAIAKHIDFYKAPKKNRCRQRLPIRRRSLC